MTVGRRHALLVLCFLFASAFLAGGKARAQFGMPQGQHHPNGTHPWDSTLTPEQLKAALDRLGSGGPNADFLQMLKNKFFEKNPEWAQNPEFQKAFEKMTADPKLMEQFKEFAQKNKTGKVSNDELGKLLKQHEESKAQNAAPKDIAPPTTLPGQPKKAFDHLDPKVFPPPKAGGGDATPKVEPQIPQGSKRPHPAAPQPMQPNALPQQNPFGQPDEPTDPRAKSLSALAALWERNVGPLDETPEVKKALFDLVSGENGFDFDLKDESGNSIWDSLKGGDADNLFEGGTNDGSSDSNWPKFEWLNGSGDWFNSAHSSSQPPSHSVPDASPSQSSGGGAFGGLGSVGGLSAAWLPFALLALLIAAAALASWWLLREGRSAVASFSTGGVGPWPIDPHAINTRADVVKAFEYLSVLLCGPSAKMWTHGTIAAALCELATTNGDAAVKLARLYELARYAPLDEPLQRHEIIEARRLVCDLAGVV